MAPAMALGAGEGVRLRPNPDDQVTNAMLGMLFPAGGEILGRVFQSARGLVELTEASRRAKAAGLPYSAGDAAGPGLAKRMLNEAANEAIGETGTKVSKENLTAAATRLNANYKDLAGLIDSTGRVQLPPDTIDAIELL